MSTGTFNAVVNSIDSYMGNLGAGPESTMEVVWIYAF